MKEATVKKIETDYSTLPAVLTLRAATCKDQTAFTFLQGDIRTRISYGNLHEQAIRLAAFLTANRMEGRRAILLYPPGMDFVIGFFACLYAGVIAVPTSPPATDRLLHRIIDISRDAEAAMVLTNREVLSHLKKLKTLHQLMTLPVINHLGKILLKKAGFSRTTDFGKIPLVAADVLLSEDLESILEVTSLPEILPDDIAFLQYTSGSTGSPKGVVVNHQNILHNSGLIRDATRMSPASVGLNWLPIYHDMGIITGIMHPVHVGFMCHQMSPLDFIRNPLSWLHSISENRVTHSGGPNFAYAMCVRRFDPQMLKGVDLSSWQVAFTGAEPVQPDTVREFARCYEPYGFRAESLMPCYGLAECTVGVCWARFGEGAVIKEVDAEFLRHDVIAPPRTVSSTRQLVSSGCTDGDLEIVIVDPETQEILDENQVGEIWLAGDSVAAGYWRKKAMSAEVFEAEMVHRQQRYLRSGDLGFVSDRELYVTGRIKDLIIIRGKNHYPQDIEASVETAHPAIRRGSVTAFSVAPDGKEALAVALEVKSEKKATLGDVIKSARRAISVDHQVVPYVIVLLAPRCIPKTSSGKLQRKKCRQMFENDEFKPVQRWIRQAVK